MKPAGLKALGRKTKYSFRYAPGLLESFPNRHPGAAQWVSFVCAEFTALCPLTAQPDFGRIFVNYVAGPRMVESKSLKLYLFSFRDHGAFHEDCVQTICDDLAALMRPRFLEVIGEFNPRGGIAICPYSSAHDGSPEWAALARERRAGYAPGKYTLSLGRPY